MKTIETFQNLTEAMQRTLAKALSSIFSAKLTEQDKEREKRIQIFAKLSSEELGDYVTADIDVLNKEPNADTALFIIGNLRELGAAIKQKIEKNPEEAAKLEEILGKIEPAILAKTDSQQAEVKKALAENTAKNTDPELV